MDNEQFNIIQHKLDEINRNIVASHQQQYGWAQDLKQRQINIEKRFGISDDTLPYSPVYPADGVLSPDYPEIFNKYGEPMEMFFQRDTGSMGAPNSKYSRYIIWDRYNYGLKTHFYTESHIFKTLGKPERRFAILVEPRSIQPQVYQAVLDNKNYIENHFEAIFTFDTEVLATFKNAKLYYFGGVYYGRDLISEDAYKRKTKNISMICSAKEMCIGHIRRKKLAFKCKNEHLADTYGQFDGGGYIDIAIPFEQYRYDIAVENDVEPFYFTEKLLNCFVSQTIPIYCGATQIDKLFNPNGIIQISVDDFDHIEDILKNCTPEDYEKRLPAVIENYWRSQYYLNFNLYDRIYKDYLKPTK